MAGTGKERIRRRVQAALFGEAGQYEANPNHERTLRTLKSDTRTMKDGGEPTLSLEQVTSEFWDKFPKAARKWLKTNKRLHGGVN